jgi:hypothetical protein
MCLPASNASIYSSPTAKSPESARALNSGCPEGADVLAARASRLRHTAPSPSHVRTGRRPVAEARRDHLAVSRRTLRQRPCRPRGADDGPEGRTPMTHNGPFAHGCAARTPGRCGKRYCQLPAVGRPASSPVVPGCGPIHLLCACAGRRGDATPHGNACTGPLRPLLPSRAACWLRLRRNGDAAPDLAPRPRLYSADSVIAARAPRATASSHTHADPAGSEADSDVRLRGI